MRHARVLTALAGILLALTACGGVGEDGSTGSGSSAEPFAGLTPKQILDKATAAAGSATSVHMKGDVKEEDSTFTIDMAISEGKGATGRLTLEGETVELRQLGKAMYVKGGPLVRLAPQFADKWVRSDAKDAAEFESLTTMDKVFDDMLKPEGAITLVPGKDVAGVKTVGLQDTEAGDGETKDKGILYVAAEGKPYPMLIESTGTAGGLRFLDWDEPVTITAPPKGDVVTEKEVQEAATKG